MRNGDAYVLTQWKVDDSKRVVTGTGELQGPDRAVRQTGAFTIPVKSVALFETNVASRSNSATALTIMTGVSLGVSGVCLADEKACFGSCPTFYVSDGSSSILQAEGFSASVLPSLEARDVDALYRAHPTQRDFAVTMKNEALETHITRYVHVLAARRPGGGRVVAGQDGTLWGASNVTEPASCRAAEGDCLGAIRHFDGKERWSEADKADLATKETIDLDFVASPDGPLGIVISSRQSLLSTFLFYQGLAYLGRSAGAAMAEAERDGNARDALQGLARAMGGIEVMVPDGAGWRVAGETNENGPLASDVKVVPLPAMRHGDTRVRLRLAKGHWRIDYIAMTKLEGPVQPLPLEPLSVTGRDGKVAQGVDIVTLPGDELTFSYRLPAHPENYELFLDTRGYYLEWMRDEWLPDEDPVKAARLILDPEQALRDLAPVYKRREPSMEKAFWNSRYVPR